MSQSRAHNELSKKIDEIDETLKDRLLYLWMERCKLKHSMAFFQYRKMLPNPKLHDLMPLFNEKKEFLLQIMRTFQQQIKENQVQRVVDPAGKLLEAKQFVLPGHGCDSHFERKLIVESFEEMGMCDPFN